MEKHLGYIVFDFLGWAAENSILIGSKQAFTTNNCEYFDP
jgi:hypothetical protein